MRRADRLFNIIQILRGGRLRTAREIAEKLEVSTRTIWRDIADLQAQGVPIDGARGVGYLLREDHFIPPLALTATEVEALVWGVRFVEAYGDESLAEAAHELLIKIAAVTPQDRRDASRPIDAFAATTAQMAKGVLATIRQAVAGQRKLVLTYRDLNEQVTTRTVRPLQLEFWGQVWTLTTWCERREDFRVFRCDRIIRMLPGERFIQERGRRLSDFLALLREKDCHDQTD